MTSACLSSLPSDDWIRDLDYQRPSVMSTRTTESHRIPPIRARYHELPDDIQGRLLAEINQELIDFETTRMAREFSNEAFNATVSI